MSTFIVSDIEGTLTSGAMWRAIAAYLNERGREKDNRQLMKRNLPGLVKYRLGLGDRISFQNHWIVQQARLLAGAPEAEMTFLADWIVENVLWPRRRQRVIDELLVHAANRRQVLLASGLFQPVVDAFARRVRIPGLQAIGTPLAFESGRFTGRLSAAVCNGAEKAWCVQEAVEDQMILAAYSDSYSDLPMLTLSRIPVAVFPEKALAAYAQDHGWRVISD